MDISDLFLSCRRGDLQRIQYLVEQKEIDLNIRDKWDSTPLYYACLCGHMDVVRYLLSSGARCEANTFDGERCIYGALNDEIRKLLLSYKVVTSQTLRRDLYEEFLRKLLDTGEYSDVSFVVQQEQFHLHKCILSARSDYFCNMFQTRWKDRLVIHISNDLVKPEAFKSLMQYLYTARLETHIDTVEDCVTLTVQCKLDELKQKLEEMFRKVTSFECMKPGTHVKTLLLESPDLVFELQQDFGVMSEQALPPELCNWVGGCELPLMPRVPPCFVDIVFVVERHKFLCHKVFFCSRSEYFRALLEDHFSEAEVDDSQNLPVIHLHSVTAEVFSCIVYYIYQNTCKFTPANCFDVLCAADEYLLPGLKRQVGNYISMMIEPENVVNVLKTSRMFELPRLEGFCVEYIAKNIDKMRDNTDLHAIILEDAREVQSREETDSITVVDEIRYHITSAVQTYSEMAEAAEHLQLIDSMLEELGLDA